MTRLTPLVFVLGLSGCMQLEALFSPTPATIDPGPDITEPETLDPTPPERPPETARTAEEFDTTTAEDRADAADVTPTSGERQLGTVVASLGDPTEPGFWLKTGLVTELTEGRIETSSGESANVELRPSGETGTAAQISLATLRLLNIPLTDLPQLTVYAN